MRTLNIPEEAIEIAERTLVAALVSGHWQASIAALAYVREWEETE